VIEGPVVVVLVVVVDGVVVGSVVVLVVVVVGVVVVTGVVGVVVVTGVVGVVVVVGAVVVGAVVVGLVVVVVGVVVVAVVVRLSFEVVDVRETVVSLPLTVADRPSAARVPDVMYAPMNPATAQMQASEYVAILRLRMDMHLRSTARQRPKTLG
jgi:hypothetical protein